MDNVVIRATGLKKLYKLYERPIDRLKESLSIVNKKYHKEYYALDNVNFEVRKGETVGIIGTNGAGKSTLLKIITGLLEVSEGEIEVKGKVSALLELGAGFNPEYTGIENIYLNGTMMGYTEKEMEGKIEQILKFADIGDFVYQPVKNYSSGMFARLAFAVAINVEPDILIVDEALSVGDVFFQSKCFAKFEQLRENGTTILFVSHDLGSIRQMCSRVLWLEKGQQKLFGETQEVCKQYINQQFIKENSLKEAKKYNTVVQQIDSRSAEAELKVYPALNANDNSIFSEEVEIISCFITDKAKNRVNSLEVLEEYTIHVVGKIKVEYINDLIFGIILENSKGINLLALNSYINNNEKVMDGRKGDILEVDFKLTLPKIIKGEYLISPAIAKGTQKDNIMLTWLHGAVSINILNSGYNLSLLELDATTQLKRYKEENILVR